jgi:hypothetical protein
MDFRDEKLVEAFGHGRTNIADDFVFCTVTGSLPDIRGNIAQRYFVPVLEAAGLRRIRFHDLRQHADSWIMPNPERQLFRPLRLALLSVVF